MSQATPLEAPANRVDRRVQAFRAHVLACAEALFAERGIEGTKIDDVCEAADVAKRTLCNHFPTKSHLVEALAVVGVLTQPHLGTAAQPHFLEPVRVRQWCGGRDKPLPSCSRRDSPRQ